MELPQVKQRSSIVLRRLLNQTGLARKKVFAVGFNKTGTSSLHALFESLGRPSYHGNRWRSCDDLALLRAYDCFSDGIPKDLAKLDRLFPGSKFILQVRDLDGWIYSRLAHVERSKKAHTYKGGAHWDATEEAVKAWVRERNAHHLSVLSYFSERPSDLLVVNFIRDEAAATKICGFLGKTGSYRRPEKNMNTRKSRPAEHTAMIGRSIAALGIPERELEYDIYCPSIAGPDARAGFPPDTDVQALFG